MASGSAYAKKFDGFLIRKPILASWATAQGVPCMSSETSPTAGRTVPDDYSVTRVRDTLGQTLRAYIEAQYHIRDVCLIRERSRLLNEPGSVAQLPYVEAPP